MIPGVTVLYVTVASFKGGVGKSTTSIHLATYLATNQGRRVLLVDQDPNRTCLDWAERSDAPTPFDVVDIDTDLNPDKYDDVVLDTQGRPDTELLEALSGADNFLVLPSTCDAFAIAALLKTIDQFEGLGTDQYRVLLTQVPPPPSKSEHYARETLSGYPLFKTGIRRFAAYEKAAAFGVPVFGVRAMDRNAGVAWSDYESVGAELWQIIR